MQVACLTLRAVFILADEEYYPPAVLEGSESRIEHVHTVCCVE